MYNLLRRLRKSVWRWRRRFNRSDVSQHGEAQIIRQLLRPEFPKYLVDVGAYDGKTLSNSWSLIQEGWHGVLIEPLPEAYAKLHERYSENPRVVCVNKACSERQGSQPLYIGSDGDSGTMSTLCVDSNEWFTHHRTDTFIEVQTDTLSHILLNSDQLPRQISLLLIDTEGMDYEVLLGLDFSLFNPLIIVTEEYLWNQEKHEKKYTLLQDAGYSLHTRVGCNTIWVSPEISTGL